MRLSVLFLCKLLLPDEQRIKIASRTVLEDEVELFLVLKGGVKVDDERVV